MLAPKTIAKQTSPMIVKNGTEILCIIRTSLYRFLVIFSDTKREIAMGRPPVATVNMTTNSS